MSLPYNMEFEKNSIDILKEIANIKCETRFSNYLSNHKKVGRNDICPCGSGLKYK